VPRVELLARDLRLDRAAGDRQPDQVHIAVDRVELAGRSQGALSCS
jgi:hypothetical protein